MIKRKRVALLVGQPEETYQNNFIMGFIEEASEADIDVCVFTMYQKYQDTAAREKGESNIFSLPDYDVFDAIVILSDTIQTPDVLENIEENLHASYQGFVLCIDKESKYFPYVMTDHYTASKQVVAHLIEHHGFTDIAYVTGREAHPHSIQRLQGFLDCMKEHNLPVNQDWVFYGDFWYSSGTRVAEQLLKDREHMPQAVACANDCMAIGLAGELVKAGIRIPEDVAITGYDMLPEGRMSPKPITSAPIPAKACGKHAIHCVEAGLAGEELPEFHASVELFIGSSCGCHGYDNETVLQLRDTWETERSQGNFNSDENHIEDDLLMQKDAAALINTIFSYTHQISPFDSFHICLNKDWLEEDTNSAYTDTMLNVLSCGSASAIDRPVDLNAEFPRRELLPSFSEVREEPSAYFFSPLYFDEHCLGYAVVSYSKGIGMGSATYKKWIAIVMRSLENYRRVNLLRETVKKLQAGQIRDSLTGFYNYNGFIDHAVSMIASMPRSGYYTEVLSVGFCGIGDVYRDFGISAGNETVIDFAQMLTLVIGNGVVSALGNGEFLIAYFSHEQSESHMETIQEFTNNTIMEYDREQGLTGNLAIVVGAAAGQISDINGFEALISEASAIKNGKQMKTEDLNKSKLSESERNDIELVRDILDNNRFHYFFQPIVDAKTGEIYSYEALMRADTEQFISPLQILKYAKHLDRLYDVERATFTNVLTYIEEHADLFKGKKVFVNSIPGNGLKEDDAEVWKLLEKYHDTVVVELTEQAELDDDELASLKGAYEKIGVETAVDDYGTGYSNITNLLRYMPNYVKIDRMLLTAIHLSPQKRHFVKEIIEFAHDNQIMALAEGVETTEELKTVIALGADLIQGYYTARPSADVIIGIAGEIQNEIIQYRQLVSQKKDKAVYEAGRESRISLVKLTVGRYARIRFNSGDVTHRDATIVGMPGFEADMDIVIGDGYVGRIELQDVCLKGQKKAPVITIGEGCDVTLELAGDNVFGQGGIIVPESSKLTIQGDGNLILKQIAVDGAGIGNGKDEKHGELVFDQDGAIEIYGNTMYGVGIGSGYGGKLQINRGRYLMNMSGQDAVGIGTLFADAKLDISKGDIELHMMNVTSVGIGSLSGNVELIIRQTSVVGGFGGHQCTAIGSIDAKNSVIDVKEAIVDMDMRADIVCGIGCQHGETDIKLDHARLALKVKGKEAVSLGNFNKTGTLSLSNIDISSEVKNDMEFDIGIDSMEILDTRSDFIHNGKLIEREGKESEW